MTKEELIAEEHICNGKCQDDITKNYTHCKTCTRLKDFLAGYKAGKTDLEKENVELKKVNALLKGRNEGFEQQIMGLLIKYEEIYKRFPDLKSAMDKAQTVLKENAEPKEKNKWYSEQVCNKECAEVWGEFTEAKEIIKKLINACCSYGATGRATEEAEQFLKE